MNSPGHLLQFAFVAGLVLALALALTIRLGERLLRRILSGRGPAERARLAWWLLVTPAVSGLGRVA